ncbi:MAG TPA: hypothetical protein VKD90_13225 [Gemmataceae bacterium]|nr:hypothetical protein [Gemmataceae bacterium]
MSTTRRVGVVLLGAAIAFAAGCEKSSTTGGAGEAYSKKLVGVWEGKEDLGGKEMTVNVEFKDGGGIKITLDAGGKEPLEMSGTWKLVKEEGKTLTVETQMALDIPELKEKVPGKTDTKSFTIVFDDENSITMTQVGKPDAKNLKRKR